MGILIFPN